MKRLATFLDWLIYPLLAVLLFGPGLFLYSFADDPNRVATEILVVTAAWGVILVVAASSALVGRSLFESVRRSWALRLAAAFTAWVVAVSAFGVNPGVSLGHSFTLIAFVLMGASLVSWMERDARRRGHLLMALGALVALQGALALTQLARLPWVNLSGAFSASWLLGAFEAVAGPAKAGLPIGSFGNTNYLAEFMALSIPAVGAWAAARKGLPRVAAALGISLGLFAFIASGSRAALFGLILGTLLAAIAVWGKSVFDLRSHWRQPMSRRAVIFVGVVTIAVVGVTGGRLAHKLSHFGQSDAAIEARLVNWGVGVELAKDRPLTGAGLGTYKLMNVDKMMTVHPDGVLKEGWQQRFLQLHNEPLQLMVEAGLVGTLLVFGAFAFWFRDTRRNGAIDDRLKFGVLAGVSALLIAGLFGFPFHTPWTTVALTLLLALGLAGEATEADELPLAWRPVYAIAGVALGLVVAGQGLTKLVWPLQEGVRYEAVAERLAGEKDRDSAEIVYGLAVRHQRFKGRTIGAQVQMMFASKKYAEIVALMDASSKEGLDYGMDYYKARALFRLGRVDEAKVLFEKVAQFCKKDSTQGRGSIRFLKQIEAAEKNPAKQPKPEPAKVGAGH